MRYTIGIVIVVLIVGGVLLAQNELVFNRVKDFLRLERDQFAKQIDIGVSRLEEAAKEVMVPPPLRKETRAPTTLTTSGIISWTNTFRAQNDLAPLKENAQLREAARIKLADMFKYQYFEHVSPLGTTISDLAQRTGYEYVAVGENLALGDYENDRVLVQAWMDSPGHRANILHNRYIEIGVAVGKGIFEGVETWIAVQEFGLPLSVCPRPSDAIKAQIETLQTNLDILAQTIDEEKNKLEQHSNKRSQEFQNAVDAYNALVNQYNGLVHTAQSLIETYNFQIQQFNLCLEANT